MTLGDDVELDPYRLIVENFPDGIVFLFEERDGELRYTFADGAGLADIGLTKEELEGRPVAYDRPKDVREKALARYRSALDGDATAFEVEAEGRHFRVQLHPVPDADGAVRTGIGIAQDITEQVIYREEIERKNEQLERFNQLVLHDIRNPLNVAQARVELQRAERDSPHLESAADALDRIESLTDEMLPTVAGRVDVEPLALRDVAEQAWRNVTTDEATLRVESDRTVNADESALRRLFENLYRNAVQHGTGRGALGSADITVTVGTLPDGIYVEDDGVGIPADARETVFDHGVTSGDGTGLGLFIVKRVAEDHGWTVTVSESEAGGTRFEFTGLDAA